MDLLPSADQLDMIATVEQFAARELSATRRHADLDAGRPADPALWQAAAQLGLFALGLPEDAGGADCPVVEEALVFQTLGRHLAPPGFLGSVLAARLAHALGDEGLRDDVTAGKQRVALGLPVADGGVEVFDPDGAGLVVSVTGEPGLFAAADAGERLECLDPSVRLSHLRAWPERLDSPTAETANIGLLGTLLATATLVGIAEAARDASVTHAKDRVQFGRPIGVNQAVKHRCADMAMSAEAAASLLHFAALALRDGRPDARFQLAAAKRIATKAALDNAAANIQIHGGMGFTWEHDAHLLLTRARLVGLLFGDVRAQQATVLETAPSVP